MPIAMSAEEAAHLRPRRVPSPQGSAQRGRSRRISRSRAGAARTGTARAARSWRRPTRRARRRSSKCGPTAGDDQYGLLARDERMVDLAQDAIGKPIYLYSHKMTMKQPNEGGAWEWHQDFGYWYNYGCLAPDMMSIYVALDRATRENGCLQVLKGSHKLGRLDHVREDGQTNVEKEHLEAALKRFELVYVEMDPGDALVFDGNLLHRSDANRTDTYRWGYICSYNAVENAPFKKVREYGNYEPLRKVPAGSFRMAS